MQASLDGTALLMRNAFELETLRLHAFDRTLTMHGTLADFAHPVWQGEAHGQVDLRALVPGLGAEFIRSGVANIDGKVNGHGGDFVSEGELVTGEVALSGPSGGCACQVADGAFSRYSDPTAGVECASKAGARRRG